MTSNQIAYWSLQEQKRSNLVNEGIKRDDTESNILRRQIQSNADLQNADSNRLTATANIIKAAMSGIDPLKGLLNVK